MKPISWVTNSCLWRLIAHSLAEALSKFLDLSEPVSHLEHGNDNNAALPRVRLCLSEMTQAKCLARSKYQQGSTVTVFTLEHRDMWPKAGYLTFLSLCFLSCKTELQWDTARGPSRSQVALTAMTAAPLFPSGPYLDSIHLTVSRCPVLGPPAWDLLCQDVGVSQAPGYTQLSPVGP